VASAWPLFHGVRAAIHITATQIIAVMANPIQTE
jgi:hypothetical protein